MGGLDVRWPATMTARGWRFFNVFHPDDPIAYRIEPLLNNSYANVQPRIVPHLGGLRWNSQVAEFWGRLRSHVIATPSKSSESEDETAEKAVSDVLLVHAGGQGAEAAAQSFLDSSSETRKKNTLAIDRI